MKKQNLWICEICGRKFVHQNQQHNCEQYSIENYHLARTTQKIRNIYDLLIEQIQQFGAITLEPLKSIIAIKKRAQFCSITVQKEALKIIFRTYSMLESPRFHKNQLNGNMYYFLIYLREPEQIDEEFITWLKLAYNENL